MTHKTSRLELLKCVISDPCLASPDATPLPFRTAVYRVQRAGCGGRRDSSNRRRPHHVPLGKIRWKVRDPTHVSLSCRPPTPAIPPVLPTLSAALTRASYSIEDCVASDLACCCSVQQSRQPPQQGVSTPFSPVHLRRFAYSLSCQLLTATGNCMNFHL